MRRHIPTISLTLACGLLAAGCGSKPAASDTAQTASDAAVNATPAPLLKPLTSAAASHPAPGAANAAVNLDRAETQAAGHSEDVAAQRAAAYCYYRLQAYAQAVPAFQKVILLAQTNVQDRMYLGYAQMAAGMLDDAIATFLTVTEMKGQTPADTSEAYLQIAACDWALQHDDQAAEAFSRSLAANPHQGMASLGIGTFYAETGKRDAAKAAFNNAVRDLPPGKNRAQAYACLGRVAEDAKDKNAALTDYHQALAIDGKNAWAKSAIARLTGGAKH